MVNEKIAEMGEVRFLRDYVVTRLKAKVSLVQPVNVVT